MLAAALLSLTAAAPAPATAIRSDAPAGSAERVPSFAETLTPDLIALM